jgi:FkbM family methyltransferase
MSMFKSALKEELVQSQSNHFGIDNFDEHRFGNMILQTEQPDTLFHNFKQLVKKVIGYDRVQEKKITNELINKTFKDLEKYEDGLSYLYENVDSVSKELIVKIIAYRTLGFSKVKLPFNNQQYWKSLELVKSLKEGNDKYDPHFMHFILEKFDLSPIGFNIKLFFSEVGIAIDFIAEQYSYKYGNKTLIQANRGETVLDIGGCWGDTALYFADKVGKEGKVYSFEFIPDNIKLHNINTALNPNLKDQIELVTRPASNISGLPIYFKDNGPGSKIELHPFKEQTGTTTTISIDDFVMNSSLQNVDFIKMDIEGAEPLALEGAIETIKKYKPILAIAIYHSMEDFINIPRWILNLNLGYELYIGHYTIHAEETICFAKPKGK